MKPFVTIIVLSMIIGSMIGCKNNENRKESMKPIETNIPHRPNGQKDVLQLATEKIDTVRVGFIGLGMRGSEAVERYLKIPGAKVAAICDLHADRVESVQKDIIQKVGLSKVPEYSNSENAWKELCDRDDIDLVYIATDWKHHAEMILYALEKGKHVACEVPAAMTLSEIWAIVDMTEKKQLHCMMLENCVYDYFELTTLNMAQQGLFGEILHAEGGYVHNLYDFWDYYENDWRMKYNKEFRGDIYATHGIGPVCQLMNIHRGDKMNILVSMDTKPVNIPEYLIKKRGISHDEAYDFANGQNTMTMISTEKGKSILIQHDVSTPRPYSRLYQVSGTKGFAQKYPISGYAFQNEVFSETGTPDYENLNSHSFVNKEIQENLMKKYEHPIQKEIGEKAKEVGGHGGMDFIMDYRLIYCLRNGLPLDMDVYDLAEWSCLAELSRISMENNNAPVSVPDFTRGKWNVVNGYKHAFKKD